MSTSPLIVWSSILVSNMRYGVSTKVMRRQLADDIPPKVLYAFDDTAKKVFWLNIYNAYFIHLTNLSEKPAKDQLDTKFIKISRHMMSLNDIERDILCGYRSTYFGGRFRKLRVSKHFKKLAVKKYDPRVHFALARGVQYGPELICYNLAYIENQLTYAAGVFLERNIEIDEENKKVVVHKYFEEYYNAMGGKENIIEIIYDWTTIELDDFEFSYKDFNEKEDIIRYADEYHLASFLTND